MLATAAEAIRIITALVYPILPDAASKVWQQLGQGEIADAAKHAFLTNLAWGGLKPGTKFGEPAPLFPRAEKDAVTVCRISKTKTIKAPWRPPSQRTQQHQRPRPAICSRSETSAGRARSVGEQAPRPPPYNAPASTEDGQAGTRRRAPTQAPGALTSRLPTAQVDQVPPS